MSEYAKIPTSEDITRAIAEGKQAAIGRKGFADYCPYSFIHYDGTQELFLIERRPLVDAWFKGWKDQLASENLGFTFQPIRTRKK